MTSRVVFWSISLFICLHQDDDDILNVSFRFFSVLHRISERNIIFFSIMKICDTKLILPTGLYVSSIVYTVTRPPRLASFLVTVFFWQIFNYNQFTQNLNNLATLFMNHSVYYWNQYENPFSSACVYREQTDRRNEEHVL